jgi:hypothetical protein
MSTALRTYYRGRNLVTMRDEVAATSRTYHFDHQGTTQCLTDSTGAVTDRFASDAWGVQVKRTGSSTNRHWYVGNRGYYRRIMNCYDLRTDVLSALQGRLLAQAAVRGNLYTYASNVPTRGVTTARNLVTPLRAPEPVMPPVQPPLGKGQECPTKAKPTGAMNNQAQAVPTPSCNTICQDYAKAHPEDADAAGGGIVCAGSTRCACIWNTPRHTIGQCPEIDDCAFAHEKGHCDEVQECDPCIPGPYRPFLKDSMKAREAECSKRGPEADCLAALVRKYESQKNYKCVGQAFQGCAKQREYDEMCCKPGLTKEWLTKCCTSGQQPPKECFKPAEKPCR